MATTKNRRDHCQNWALCTQPNGGKELPKRFTSKEEACNYRDQIIVSASMYELTGPPRVERAPDGFQYAQLPDAVGPVCPILIRTHERIALQKVSRKDSAGNEWIVLERQDGKQWPELTDETDAKVNAGIGAFRRIDGPNDPVWGEIVDGQARSIPPPFPPGYRDEERRRDRARQSVIPIVWLADLDAAPCADQHFKEYFPAAEAVEPQGRYSLGRLQKEIAEIFRSEHPDFSCDLGADWHFEEIQDEAASLPSCNFRDSRRIDNLACQLALIAHDLEDVLLRHQQALSAEALASFWTSWTVWNYIAFWAIEVATELDSRRIAHVPPTLASAAIQRQMWAFARSVRKRDKKSEKAAPPRPGLEVVMPSDKPASKVRRHGFDPHLDHHRAIAAVVERFDPNWRTSSNCWKDPNVLASICEGLDQARSGDERDLCDIPESWGRGKPRVLGGATVSGWKNAFDLAGKKLIVDQIKSHLKVVQRHDPSPPSLQQGKTE